MHSKQGYSNISLLLGGSKVTYVLNEPKVKMGKNSIVSKLAKTFGHRWPSYWKLALLLIWQCPFLHNLPSHAWNDGLKLLSFAKDMSWLPQTKRRQHQRMELEAVTALQLLCKQPPAGKEHPRDSTARVPPSHLTSDHQSYLRFTRIVSLPLL